MLKRIVLIAILAIQTAAVCSVAKADMPFPKCFPTCPPDGDTPPPPPSLR